MQQQLQEHKFFNEVPVATITSSDVENIVEVIIEENVLPIVENVIEDKTSEETILILLVNVAEVNVNVIFQK